MSNIFLTSDQHLGHDNIRKYCGRPFSTVDKMNNTIIKNHNEMVKNEDTVYIDGDFCFHNTKGGKEGEGQLITAKDWIKKLNGKLIFAQGNHDQNNGLKCKNHRIVIKYAKMYIGITHKPSDVVIEDDLYYYPLHFTGHVHEKWITKEKTNKNGKIALMINVGVDQWNFRPVNIADLITVYFRWLNTHERKEEILYWTRQTYNRKK
ncbi:MAG: metallophosphoesterase [Novosphingobium sp.]|nr:metallophosphoesterase [Novosphingobium sp.]